MPVTNAWCGALTADSIRVNAKITAGAARLAVDTGPSMTGAQYYSFGPPTAQSVVDLTAGGLDPDTQYYWALEVGGALDLDQTGQFRTVGPPGEPYSFMACASGCAGTLPEFQADQGLAPDRVSDHPVFDDIRFERDWRGRPPQLWFQMGDLAYYDFGSGVHVANPVTADMVRDMFDSVLSTRQGGLMRNVPTVYIPDDHDQGPNDCDGTNTNKALVASVYRERVPSYPLVEANARYHSFQVGRVWVIVTDERYYRDAPAAAAPRTYLGATQLAWFEDQLANPPGGSEFLVWVSEQPSSSGGATSWGSYPEERTNIYTMLGDHGWLDAAHPKAIEIAADQHTMGFDSGAHTVAGLPLYTLSSLDSNPGAIGGYDLFENADNGQYGRLTFLDYGNALGVTVDGMNHG